VRFVLVSISFLSSQLAIPFLPSSCGRFVGRIAQGSTATSIHWFTQSLVSHHFHIYRSSWGDGVAPVENTFIHVPCWCSHKIEFASQPYCLANSFHEHLFFIQVHLFFIQVWCQNGMWFFFTITFLAAVKLLRSTSAWQEIQVLLEFLNGAFMNINGHVYCENHYK
jgi:hypothetical protein